MAGPLTSPALVVFMASTQMAAARGQAALGARHSGAAAALAGLPEQSETELMVAAEAEHLAGHSTTVALAALAS